MYILYKLQPRAETTDTLIIYASKDRGLLEEIILSVFDTLFDKELELTHFECMFSDADFDLTNLTHWCIEQTRPYDIVWVPELED